MSLGNTTANELGALIFNATTMADFAENDTTSPAVNIDVALHTASPGAAGTMSTNEIVYTSYARVVVARTSGGWTVAASNVSNTAAITFPQATGGGATATDFSVGKTGGGATQILVFGTLDSSLAISNGITPEFAIGALDINWS